MQQRYKDEKDLSLIVSNLLPTHVLKKIKKSITKYCSVGKNTISPILHRPLLNSALSYIKKI